ncbi:MAG: glutamate-cysteine ligase family protein [Actinomycetota bacterium]
MAFPSASARRVGVETEWFTTPSSSPPDIPTLHGILDPLLPLPHGSAITYEPGAQVELSSSPHDDCGAACVAIAADADVVRAELERHDIGVFAAGMDPDRPLRLSTTEPRYVAMRAHLDGGGEAGARMMCTSAAVHVNLDAGRDDVGRRRWRLAHDLGPVLVAAFANSPVVHGRPTGWKSSRMAAWLGIDPSRAGAVTSDGDPSSAWADYALTANVMFIRAPEAYVPQPRPFAFGRWMKEGHELGYPTEDDLAYHLTTLFPPVRPQGRLELRMIDMVPDPWWRVAVAVATALLYDEEAVDRAEPVSARSRALWHEAARFGLEHPLLRDAGLACFEAALRAAARIGCDETTGAALSEYTDRFVRRGRSPADDVLEELGTPTTSIAEAI